MCMCANVEEIGAHLALVCIENERLERHFGSWEQIDDPKRVLKAAWLPSIWQKPSLVS